MERKPDRRVSESCELSYLNSTRGARSYTERCTELLDIVRDGHTVGARVLELDDRLVALDLPIARDQTDAGLGHEDAADQVDNLERLGVGVGQPAGLDEVVLDEGVDQVQAAQAVAAGSAQITEGRDILPGQLVLEGREAAENARRRARILVPFERRGVEDAQRRGRDDLGNARASLALDPPRQAVPINLLCRRPSTRASLGDGVRLVAMAPTDRLGHAKRQLVRVGVRRVEIALGIIALLQLLNCVQQLLRGLRRQRLVAEWADWDAVVCRISDAKGSGDAPKSR